MKREGSIVEHGSLPLMGPDVLSIEVDTQSNRAIRYSFEEKYVKCYLRLFVLSQIQEPGIRTYCHQYLFVTNAHSCSRSTALLDREDLFELDKLLSDLSSNDRLRHPYN